MTPRSARRARPQRAADLAAGRVARVQHAARAVRPLDRQRRLAVGVAVERARPTRSARARSAGPSSTSTSTAAGRTARRRRRACRPRAAPASRRRRRRPRCRPARSRYCPRAARPWSESGRARRRQLERRAQPGDAAADDEEVCVQLHAGSDPVILPSAPLAHALPDGVRPPRSGIPRIPRRRSATCTVSATSCQPTTSSTSRSPHPRRLRVTLDGSVSAARRLIGARRASAASSSRARPSGACTATRCAALTTRRADPAARRRALQAPADGRPHLRRADPRQRRSRARPSSPSAAASSATSPASPRPPTCAACRSSRCRRRCWRRWTARSAARSASTTRAART